MMKDILADVLLTIVVAFVLGFFIWYSRQADQAVRRYEQIVNQLPESQWAKRGREAWGHLN